MKQRANHERIQFKEVKQAELIIFLMSILNNYEIWFPHTLLYWANTQARFPIFIKAKLHREFEYLKIITGVLSGDELRDRYMKKCAEQPDFKSFGRYRFPYNLWGGNEYGFN